MGASRSVILADFCPKHFEENITADKMEPESLKMNNNKHFPLSKD